MHKAQHLKILLCDASFSAIPILKALKSKGHIVGVCGSRESDPCHKLADMSFVFDYSDQSKLLQTFKDNHFQYIVPGCTDISYLSSSWVANALGLPGFDCPNTVDIFQHKGKFREHCKTNGYPVPLFTNSIENIGHLKFPILVKPVDSFSGKGISKLKSIEELQINYQNSEIKSVPSQTVFEEFVSGKLYSHSAFIKNGKILIDFFVNEYCTVYPYQVNSSNLATLLEAVIKAGIRTWLESFAQNNNLCDGLIHTQFISDGNHFWLIETCRRCPGDLYSLLIQLSTHINYADLYCTPFYNGVYRLEGSDYQTIPMSRHTVSVKEDCFFISSSVNIPNIKSTFFSLQKTGEFIREAPYDRSGIYFIEYQTHKEMEEYTEQLVNYIQIETLTL